MRVAPGVLRMQANLLKQLGNPFRPSGSRQDIGVNDPGLRDDLGNRHLRIERGIGILEDNLNLPPELHQIGR